jgi:hypothetical protein
MATDLLERIRISFDQLLAGTGAYYQELERMLEHPDLDEAVRDQVGEALARTTQLVEVLESVTFDRIRWLAEIGVPA